MLTGDERTRLPASPGADLPQRPAAAGRWTSPLGGLNYQIEHHLFPSMPTPNLRRAQPIVRAYCAELGVAYHESGLIDSYAQALRSMHASGAPLRARSASPGAA